MVKSNICLEKEYLDRSV